ncbi:MAG: RNA polymerase sigma-70 factor [Cyclobacteriaceae bacterium]|nr:RNA polymerase sigma-70 factor [Cyclobacteriaceae bacterium]
MNLEEHHTDEELVSFLTQDNEQAFEIIYTRYASELYRYVRKSISIKEDCEEIVQDVFESLWNRRGNVSITNLSSYLFSAVRYKAISYFQRSLVRKKYEEHFKFFELLYDNSEELQMSPTEASAIIQRCVRELPQRYQEVVNLRVYEQLTNQEIARKMNVTPQTVEIYFSNALKGLRTAYRAGFRPIKS